MFISTPNKLPLINLSRIVFLLSESSRPFTCSINDINETNYTPNRKVKAGQYELLLLFLFSAKDKLQLTKQL